MGTDVTVGLYNLYKGGANVWGASATEVSRGATVGAEKANIVLTANIQNLRGREQ